MTDIDLGDGQYKKCNACSAEKPLSEFNFRYDRKLPAPRSECRECQKTRTRIWRESPQGLAKEVEYKSDTEIQQRLKENRRIPERIRNDIERGRRWRRTPEGKKKLALISKRSQSKPASKTQRSRRRKERYRSDPTYHCEVAVRAMLGRVLKVAGVGKEAKTFEALGYTANQFRQRIECQFSPGMSWGTRSHRTWHVDHKKPVSAFVKQGIIDPKVINALCNLRPVWAPENLAKGASWPPTSANKNIEVSSAA